MPTPLRTDVTIDEWVEALESGRYTHGVGQLNARDGTGQTKMCCLGVLLDLAGAQWLAVHDDARTSYRLLCLQIGDSGGIAAGSRDLLGPEIAGVLNHSTGPEIELALALGIDPKLSAIETGHDLLVGVNDTSREGYVPAIKVLRRLQEEVPCGTT